MRKHLLLVFLTLFAISLSAADLNPFAYNLYTSTNTDGGTRLHFSINAFAPSVEVYIMVNSSEKLLRTYTNVAKNNYYTDITASDASSLGMTKGNSYSWKVKVTTPDRSSDAEYVGRKVDDKPIFSIDIDNNPDSPYFGRILATHGTDNIANEQGIFAYNAAFEADGGRNMGTGVSTYTNWWSGNHLTPYRIRIAQDGSGRIFLGNYDLSQTGAYLWQVDPANLKSWTRLIARSWMKSNVGTNVDDLANQIDVYNMGLDIRTNGNQYELLLLSANNGNANFITGSIFSGVYTIPDITKPTTNCTYKQLKWTKVTGEQSIRNLFGSALNGSAIYDKYGGVWYCGNSSNGTQGSYPGLAHQFATANTYKINYDDNDTHFQKQFTSAGGIRYDKNYNRMVVAQGMNRTNIVGRIYTVAQASAGTRPTLGSPVDLNAGAAKGSASWYVTDFAWDYADNIYACVRNTSDGVRGVYAFATDLGGKVLDVGARNSFQLQLPSGVKEGTTGLNPYAYDVRAQFDESTHKLIVNFSLNADAYNDGIGGNADGVQIYLTDDPANPKKYYVHAVPGNQCFKGQNKTCTIDLISGKDKNGKDIPRNTNLYASVTVQGDRTNANPRRLESQSYRIYCGHGVAVDKNPNSKNFGKIFITEASQGTTSRNAYTQTKSLPGLYVLDPDFGFTSTTRYTGENNFSAYGTTKPGYEPWRVRVSQDGRIFVCSNDVNSTGVAVWEVDPNNFNKWTPVLKGSRSADYTFQHNPSGYKIGIICGMDVKNTGDDLTLLLYTADKSGTEFAEDHYFAYEYKVSSNTLTPIPAFHGIKKFAIVHDLISMVYGVDGSYWFGASRSAQKDNNNKAFQRNVAHVKLDKSTIGYENYNGEFEAGGGIIEYKSTYNNATYNAENHTWLIKGRLVGERAEGNGHFGIFLVQPTNDGKTGVARMDGTQGRPNWSAIEIPEMGYWLNDFAIDYAENLYVVGSSDQGTKHGIYAFAMPYCGEKTTTVRNAYFQLKGQAITWHPYHCPETMINEDLWELFMEDYNEWYFTNKKILPEPRSPQPITNAIGFTFSPDEIKETYPNGLVQDFLTNHPQWKWLHNYINTVVENDAVTSNEALWAAFKTDADITSLGTLAELKLKAGEGFTDICGNDGFPSKDVSKLSNVLNSTDWQWLKSYIQSTQRAQKGVSVVGDDGTTRAVAELPDDITTQPALWRFAVAAFFLQSQYTKGFPATADFSTAGLPTAWGPIAKAAGKTYAFSLTGELTWRLHVHAFFNKTNSITHETKIYTTADFSEAGDPHAWYNTWADVTFPKTLRTGDKMPKIKRKGYIFAGWHYGTEEGFTRDQKVADAGYDESVTNNKHIWARWMELCLYEGYNKPDPHFLGEPAKVNYNEELMNRAAGASYYIDIERNLSPGMYNTITLPFAIPKPRADFLKKVTDENGAHVFDPEQGGVIPSIYVYEGTEEVEVGEETVLQFNFHELGEEEVLFPNTPFLIKTNNPEKLSARLHFWSAHISSAQHAAVSPSQVSFVPVLGPQTMTIPNGAIVLILVSDNRLAKVTAPGEILGLRGYFSMPESMKSMPAQICIKENASTDTEEVEANSVDGVYKILDNQRVYIIRGEEVYTIMGDRVR